MRFIHLSDLHIGKRVNGFSMLEDQRFILKQILEIAENTDAAVIAGDVYDKTIPPAEAVELFDEFLTSLSEKHIPVLIISGNHDSAERIAFASKIINKQNIYISGVFRGSLDKITIDDIDFYLMPFIKPVHVKQFFPDTKIESYEDAVKTILQNTNIDTTRKNVLIAHQFITCSHHETLRCDSESVSVGGIDNIDVSVFDCFDYVALGHIHNAQSIGRDSVRYAGSPLKYSFSEARHNKSVTVVTIDEEVKTELIPLTPIRDMREIKGDISSILSPEIYTLANTDDYVHVTLTDDDEILDAISKVRAVYPNVMAIDFCNNRTKALRDVNPIENTEQKSPFDLFGDFYEIQNNEKMNEDEEAIVRSIFESYGDDR